LILPCPIAKPRDPTPERARVKRNDGAPQTCSRGLAHALLAAGRFGRPWLWPFG